MDLLSIILLVTIGLVTYLFLKMRRPTGFPPGPPAVPLFGSIPFMKYGGGKFHLEFERQGEKYGGIFSMALGHTWIVVLNDFESLRECLVNKAVEFAGRITDPRFEMFNGIADGDYSTEWVNQRHTSMVLMRNFGWGKKAIAEKMSEEREILLEILRNTDQKPFIPDKDISCSVYNIIGSMLFAELFDHGDPVLENIVENINLLMAASASEAHWDYVPFFSTFSSKGTDMVAKVAEAAGALNEFAEKQIQKRIEMDKESPIEEPRDFTESYILELRAAKEGKSRIKEDWACRNIVDFLIGGIDTSATILRWLLVYISNFPEVQKKMQEQLDEVLGAPTGRGMSTLADREKLPYFEAVTMEVLRMSTLFPLALVHKTTADVVVKGYTIPKNTQIRTNLHSVLYDPKLWDEPKTFNPNRFLSEDGRQVKKIQHWVPFSMGRRMCMGEQVARQEIFMFLSAIVHSFTIKTPEGTPPPSLEPAVYGIALAPQKTAYIFEPRF